MLPPPEGEAVVVSVYLRVKLAVTGTLGSLARVTTVQVPAMPLQPPPDQPVNRYCTACVDVCDTVSVTDWPQFTVRLPFTVPPAEGEGDPVTVHCGVGVGVGVGLAVKVTLTLLSLVIVTVQTLALLVEAQPVQPPKVCVSATVGVISTTVFAARELRQLTLGPLVLPVRQAMLPPLPAVASSRYVVDVGMALTVLMALRRGRALTASSSTV